ncbi:exodeoxyribonuclease III [Trueperella bernardiae]|uniref:exodeoxyribonuclease III n=1 Tax=Trueperella bernardiae TaxID=59561 RepID=UPI0008389315|nr:exodeoxyribonuclease III [Trueperella bernardiae]MCM3907436.1 exodeoxyribonuclease III [Trueperella bernardiae]OCW61222.1 exodeoxyribonuclease III [Trueperella bernardiae]WIM08439.1 exodeoxyribonuclease III [Trueperella bernardiae]
MLVATVNVNGIRAAARKGMGEWIEAADADVILLQEVRAPEELVAGLIGDRYHVVEQASALKGRAGVAVAVKTEYELGAVRRGLQAGLEPDDAGALAEPAVDTGRWIEVDVPELGTTFVSAYLHSGVADNAEKMAAKYSHLDRVTLRLAALRAERPADLPHVLVAGDFNIVHTPLDIKNWKPNHNKTAGVLDSEIAYLDRWFADYVDTQRALVGEAQGPYTWWSQRGKAFDNDAGWRIDYQMTTPDLAALAVDARVDRASQYDMRWSDHAPLIVDYQD